MPAAVWTLHASPHALAEALARSVADVLSDAIATRGNAFLAVSGGTTPTLFLGALAGLEIDWANVTVTLVDERFVPEDSERSNAAMVRAHLMRGKAAAARFAALFEPAVSVEEAADKAEARLARAPWPLDAVVLGMGLDGHTASYFPDAAELDSLLAPENDRLVCPVNAPSAGEPRLTLPLARLMEAPFIALHIEGDDKRAVLEAALASTTHPAPPVARAIDLARSPVQIHWTN